MFQEFEKVIFQFFFKFCVRKLQALSGKVRQRIQNSLNQNLVIGSFLEYGFTGTFM